MATPTLEKILAEIEQLSPEDRTKLVTHLQKTFSVPVAELDDDDDEWENQTLRQTLSQYMTDDGHLDYDKLDAGGKPIALDELYVGEKNDE